MDALRAAVGPRTRAMLLNTPHNPTGTVLTRAELQAVADVAIEHDLVVITDEVYEHLVFDDATSTEGHVPLATLPGMWERTLTLSSAGKSYSFTGWKVGWATGPADLVSAVLAAKQWLTFTSGSPLQPAVAHALDHEPRLAAGRSRGRSSHGATCSSPGSREAGLDRPGAGGDLLRDDRHQPPRLGATGASSASRCRSGPASWRSPTRRSTTPDAGRHLVRWAFCKEPDLITEGVRRLAAADLRAADRSGRPALKRRVEPRAHVGAPQAADGDDGGDGRDQGDR